MSRVPGRLARTVLRGRERGNALPLPDQVGNFESPGRTWRPYKDPVKVQDHSFPSQVTATAIPYGVYDVGSDDGFVNLGVSHDTPAFAVASIRRWWTTMGQGHYPRARRLLVVADSGGSNSIRSLVFKVLLHQMAVDTGLEITMCHLPPGTSKWNKVEHRLFAQISSTWRGRPLTSLQVVVKSIAATRTRTGLSVTCVLDERDYPTGLTSDWDHIDALPLTFHDVGGRWNYTIAPHPADPARTTTRPPHPGQPARPPTHTAPLGTPAERATWIKGLTTPETTAIPTAAWNELAAHLEPAYRHLRDQAARERRGGREKTNPNHPGPTLTVPLTTLMLATVLHVRHHTPVEQISRLIDLKSNGLKIHITRLTTLFTDHGHPITPTDTKTRKLETLLTTAHLPQPAPTTHQNTS